jgi:membrane protease YdiL (CAAX protease family)
MTAVVNQPSQEARPWGLAASLIIFVVMGAGLPPAYDAFLRATGLWALIRHSTLLQVASILAPWTLALLLTAIAVRFTGIPVARYLGWKKPRISDIALGIGIVLSAYGLWLIVVLLLGDGPGFVAAYRAEIANGTLPWWYVLRNWPAIFLASFVEESFCRGFVWYGIETYHGRLAALLVSSLLFAAMHHHYYIVAGVVKPWIVIEYLVTSFTYGAIRWRSGGTTAAIITHGANNATIGVMPIVMSPFVP